MVAVLKGIERKIFYVLLAALPSPPFRTLSVSGVEMPCPIALLPLAS